MNLENDEKLRKKAKEMLIDGASYMEIKNETHLRLKDIKRIEREEVSSHF